MFVKSKYIKCPKRVIIIIIDNNTYDNNFLYFIPVVKDDSNIVQSKKKHEEGDQQITRSTNYNNAHKYSMTFWQIKTSFALHSLSYLVCISKYL